MRNLRLNNAMSPRSNAYKSDAVSGKNMKPLMNDNTHSLSPVPPLARSVDAHLFDQASPTATPLQALLSYLQPPLERPFNYAYEPPAGAPWENYQRDERTVGIDDARYRTLQPTLNREGFALWDAPSAVRNFGDPDEIARIYYPEVAELACATTGAVRAYIFDHLVRKRTPGSAPLGFGRSVKDGPPAANGQVHNDYTEESGRKRLAFVLGELAAQRGILRYSIVNVWRSIRAPVLDIPLAVCDFRSVVFADLVSAEVRYPGRTGEIYLGLYNPHHRWSYFSAMDRQEALVFKQYDSRTDGVARFTLHAAFRHPDAPATAPPRESIEARCLVVYE
jgi:hypothetical protein